MIDNFREFQAGPDPFGLNWRVTFVWQQTGISIRHSDSVDVKFVIDDGEVKEEKVIALMHPLLLKMSQRTGQRLSDAWCMKLAALHLKRMIETGEDLEKTLVTMSEQDMEAADNALRSAAAV
ncbi:MAG: hypothetical protein FJW20_23010 [Acidimicrobiia bacterium]|nr:hypothetical protein [Acidimicrobiia bacterium]